MNFMTERLSVSDELFEASHILDHFSQLLTDEEEKYDIYMNM